MFKYKQRFLTAQAQSWRIKKSYTPALWPFSPVYVKKDIVRRAAS